jgi:Uma2 family endonuclease
LTIPPAVVNEGREGANAMATTLKPADWRNLEGATEIVPPHPVDDDALAALNRRYRPFGIERFGDGTLLVSPPSNGTGSNRNVRLVVQVAAWVDSTGSGFAFGPDGGFTFPDGAMLAPDATYVARERWLALPEREHQSFAAVVPDAVFELFSKSDRKKTTRKKIATYLRHGVRLAVLIDPFARRVYVGHAGDADMAGLGYLATLDCGPVMPGFVLDVARVLAPAR